MMPRAAVRSWLAAGPGVSFLPKRVGTSFAHHHQGQ
jgi:hypothetical protein